MSRVKISLAILSLLPSWVFAGVIPKYFLKLINQF
jgi:hypothetical protein